MKPFRSLLLFAAAALAAAPLAAQQDAPEQEPSPPKHAFLWKVQKGDQAPAYLFGTMHSPDPRVNALHPRVKQALQEADAFYAEIDLSDQAALAQRMQKATRLDAETTLRDLVSDALYEDIEAYLESQGRGQMMRQLNRFQPAMVEIQLGQLELLDDLMKGRQPLDLRLYRVAQAKGMEVGGVETVDEQIEALLHSRTQAEAIESLRDTVDRLKENAEKGISDMERMEAAWLSGRSETLLDLAHEQIDLEDPVDRKYWKALVWTRNKHMAERAARLMNEHPEKRYVFAFGALHMIGSGSVPELLRQHGFEVTRLCAPPPPAPAEADAQEKAAAPAGSR